MISTAFLIIFTICIVIISYTLQQKWKHRSLKKVAGPIQLPILGNALEFGLSPVDFLRDLYRIVKDYGRNDHVAKIRIGPSNIYIVIGNPEMSEFFMSSPKFITKSSDYNLLRPWIANGLLTSTGMYWQKRRKVITPTFHFKILEQFVSIFNSGADLLIQRLSKEVDKDHCNIYPFITAYTLDSICETAMGTTVKAQESPDNEYVKAVKTVCNIFIGRTFSAWKQFEYLFQFSNEYKIQEQNVKIIHNFTRSVIEQRRKDLLQDKSTSDVNKTEDEDDVGVKRKQAFLDLLLNSTIDGKPLTDDDITEEVDTFMFEGHDTTASAICFGLYELARNPRVQKKLYEEIYEVFGNDKHREPTLNDLNNLKYLELVLKETLRLYPSVPFFGREIQEDVTHNGITYKKGVSLIFFVYYMQRRADVFKDAEKFYPERFLPENNEIKNPFSYVPFSAGPRNCIGQKFAMYEMKSVYSKIIRNFELFPADKKYDIVLSAEVILKSANGVHLKLKKRN